jgi:4'-phosphopantetheinyl transferase
MPASRDDVWRPGPLHPLLAEDAVHVWRAHLAKAGEDLDELLHGDERARAERFVKARDGELWRRSRGLLRELLGRYLRRDPRSLRLVVGAHGKPALADDTPPRLAFSMSHSGELALYAFSAAGAVGVDVETSRRAIDEVAIAARTLGAADAERLQSLPPSARRREFLRLWTRYEAELKCLGVGIGGADAIAGELRPVTRELKLDPETGGAVATERAARELCCWEWQDATWLLRNC